MSIGDRLVFWWYAQKNARLRGSPAEQPPNGGLPFGSPLKQVSTCGGGSRKYSWLRSVFRPREDEALELCLDLGVGQAGGHRRGGRALGRRVRMGVDQRSAEGRLVPRECAGQV